jgi:hypothetical protein
MKMMAHQAIGRALANRSFHRLAPRFPGRASGRRRGWNGAFRFSGRYKSLIVDGSGNGYLKTVCDYVHLNAARAKLLAPEQPLRDYDWSSYPLYLQAPRRRPAWLRVDRLLGEHGIARDTAAGRKEFQRRMEARRAAESEEDYKAVRRGWCLGEAAFRKEWLAQMAEQAGSNHYGEEIRESAEEKAERIVVAELKQQDGRRRTWSSAGKEMPAR